MFLTVTAFSMAQRFLGMKEVSGSVDNPAILAMLRLDASWPQADEVPWCSAFVNYICWLLRLPRSKSLRARSWLLVGEVVNLDMAVVGFDVVIFSRGSNAPGPEVIQALGHVAFFAGLDGDRVYALGGNQSDGVNVSQSPRSQVLGVRRLAIQ